MCGWRFRSTAGAARLAGVEGDDVVVELEDHEVVLPFEQIQRARLVAEGVSP